jgi:hypothetical protein
LYWHAFMNTHKTVMEYWSSLDIYKLLCWGKQPEEYTQKNILYSTVFWLAWMQSWIYFISGHPLSAVIFNSSKKLIWVCTQGILRIFSHELNEQVRHLQPPSCGHNTTKQIRNVLLKNLWDYYFLSPHEISNCDELHMILWTKF